MTRFLVLLCLLVGCGILPTSIASSRVAVLPVVLEGEPLSDEQAKWHQGIADLLLLQMQEAGVALYERQAVHLVLGESKLQRQGLSEALPALTQKLPGMEVLVSGTVRPMSPDQVRLRLEAVRVSDRAIVATLEREGAYPQVVLEAVAAFAESYAQREELQPTRPASRPFGFTSDSQAALLFYRGMSACTTQEPLVALELFDQALRQDPGFFFVRIWQMRVLEAAGYPAYARAMRDGLSRHVLGRQMLAAFALSMAHERGHIVVTFADPATADGMVLQALADLRGAVQGEHGFRLLGTEFMDEIAREANLQLHHDSTEAPVQSGDGLSADLIVSCVGTEIVVQDMLTGLVLQRVAAGELDSSVLLTSLRTHWQDHASWAGDALGEAPLILDADHPPPAEVQRCFRGDRDLTTALYEHVLRDLEPESPRADEAMLLALWRTKLNTHYHPPSDRPRLRLVYRPVLDRFPESRGADMVRLLIGYEYEEEGKTDMARKTWQELLSKGGRLRIPVERVHIAMAWLSLDAGRIDEARRHLEQLPAEPSQIGHMLLMGQPYQGAFGRLIEARADRAQLSAIVDAMAEQETSALALLIKAEALPPPLRKPLYARFLTAALNESAWTQEHPRRGNGTVYEKTRGGHATGLDRLPSVFRYRDAYPVYPQSKPLTIDQVAAAARYLALRAETDAELETLRRQVTDRAAMLSDWLAVELHWAVGNVEAARKVAARIVEEEGESRHPLAACYLQANLLAILDGRTTAAGFLQNKASSSALANHHRIELASAAAKLLLQEGEPGKAVELLSGCLPDLPPTSDDAALLAWEQVQVYLMIGRRADAMPLCEQLAASQEPVKKGGMLVELGTKARVLLETLRQYPAYRPSLPVPTALFNPGQLQPVPASLAEQEFAAALRELADIHDLSERKSPFAAESRYIYSHSFKVPPVVAEAVARHPQIGPHLVERFRQPLFHWDRLMITLLLRNGHVALSDEDIVEMYRWQQSPDEFYDLVFERAPREALDIALQRYTGYYGQERYHCQTPEGREVAVQIIAQRREAHYPLTFGILANNSTRVDLLLTRLHDLVPNDDSELATSFARALTTLLEREISTSQHRHARVRYINGRRVKTIYDEPLLQEADVALQRGLPIGILVLQKVSAEHPERGLAILRKYLELPADATAALQLVKETGANWHYDPQTGTFAPLSGR